MTYAQAEIQRRLYEMIRVGKIKQVNHDERRAVVSLGDGLETDFRPWMVPSNGSDDNEWRPPSVGEKVVYISPNGDHAVGFIFAGLTSDIASPSNDSSVRMRQYENGDYQKHDSSGFTFKSGKTVIDGDFEVRGNALIEGDLNISGQVVSIGQIMSLVEVIAGVIALTKHGHDPSTNEPIP